MATRDIIVIGASAGGVQALSALVADLPPSLPAAIFIALHLSANVPSLLPGILARECKLVLNTLSREVGLHKKSLFRISLCNLCVLCVSVVSFYSEFINHRDQRTPRLHREERNRDFLCKAA